MNRFLLLTIGLPSLIFVKLTRLWVRLDPLQVVLLRLRWSLVDRLEQWRSFYQQPVGVRLQQSLFYYLYLLALFVRLLAVYLAVLNGWWDYFHRYDHFFGFLLNRRKYNPLLFLSLCLIPLLAFIGHYLLFFRASPRFWSSVHRLTGDHYRQFLDDNPTLVGDWRRVMTRLRTIKNDPSVLVFRKPIPGLEHITSRIRSRLILAAIILDLIFRLLYVVACKCVSSLFLSLITNPIQC